MLAVQESLGPLRKNTKKPPYRRTPSKHNLRAERFWCEVNQRVNYPLKTALIRLKRDNCFDLLNDTHKFCVSSVAIGVSYPATVNLIEAPNTQLIPGRSGGVPNVMAQRTQAPAQPLAASVPSVKDAVQAFSAAGGNLTLDSTFGADPLRDNLSAQKERQRRLAVHCLPI